MSRKAKKVISEKELLEILSETIRGVKDKTIEPRQAREIFTGARTMCRVVSTKVMLMKHAHDSGSRERFLE